MGIHEQTENMSGNIILFKNSGSIIDNVISFATHGPYVHTSIVVNASGKTVEATRQGIQYNTLPLDKTRYVMVSLLAPPQPMEQSSWEASIQRGIQWACSCVGKEYGWLDIVDQAFNFLYPGNTIQLVDNAHYDCSDFVCRYLLAIGYPLPEKMQSPYAVSPNDLARFFQILT